MSVSDPLNGLAEDFRRSGRPQLGHVRKVERGEEPPTDPRDRALYFVKVANKALGDALEALKELPAGAEVGPVPSSGGGRDYVGEWLIRAAKTVGSIQGLELEIPRDSDWDMGL